MLVAGVALILIYGVTMVVSGEYEVLKNPFFLKLFGISALYFVSVYLLNTLPSKSIKRRSVSWLFSIIFHAGLLFYLGVFMGFGGTILILGIAETIVLCLSLVGFGILLFNYKQNERYNNQLNPDAPKSGAPVS